MKKYLTALSATALMCAVPYALAASSTDLTVTGTITPSACTPSWSNSGQVDAGKISAKDLNPTQITLVGRHPMQLSVVCDAATRFAMTQIDNKPNTGSANSWFGLGLTNAGEKLGFFNGEITNTLADGVAAQAIDSEDGGATWSRTTVMGVGYILSVGTTTDTKTPIAVKDLTMDVDVVINIARADGLTLTDDVPLEGSATFEMKYL